MSWMLWVGAIAAIGVLIVVHETGHYLVARWCKMRVDKFSVGFGPSIWGWQRGETRFQIAPIPFGGYVQINGMLVADEVEPDDVRAYPNRPAWQRFLTIFAGPATNYVFAIILACVLYTLAGVPTGTAWYDVDGTTDTSDARGKLEQGDRILRVGRLQAEPLYAVPGGQPPRALTEIAADSGGKALAFAVLRDGQELEVEATPRAATDGSGYSLDFDVDPSGAGGRFVVTSAGESSKLRPGDELLGVKRLLFDDPLYVAYNGKAQKPLSEYVQEAGGAPLLLTVSRGGQLLPIELQPQVVPDAKAKDGGPVYQIGIQLLIVDERRDTGLLSSLGHAFWYPVRQTGDIVTGLYKVIRGEEKGEIAGPVRITSVIKRSFAAGWVSVFELLMVLNVYLGLFNLFPLPALDGGRLVFLGYEMATRRRANPKVEATVHMVGIMALLVLMVLVTYKDIASLL